MFATNKMSNECAKLRRKFFSEYHKVLQKPPDIPYSDPRKFAILLKMPKRAKNCENCTILRLCVVKIGKNFKFLSGNPTFHVIHQMNVFVCVYNLSGEQNGTCAWHFCRYKILTFVNLLENYRVWSHKVW